MMWDDIQETDEMNEYGITEEEWLSNMDEEMPLSGKRKLKGKVIRCSFNEVRGGIQIGISVRTESGETYEQKWTITSPKARGYWKRKMKECFRYSAPSSWRKVPATLNKAAIGQCVIVEVNEELDGGCSVVIHPRDYR